MKTMNSVIILKPIIEQVVVSSHKLCSHPEYIAPRTIQDYNTKLIILILTMMVHANLCNLRG